MIEALLAPLAYEYMRNAMLLAAVLGAVCGLLSCYVVLKGWSLLGDALSHAVVPGVVIAWMAGLPFALGAFASGLLAAAAIAALRARSPVREDALIGVVFTGFFGLGLFLLSLEPAGIRLRTIVFGNILGLSPEDVIQMLLISLGVLAVLAVAGRDLMLAVFDPAHLAAIGGRPRLMNALLLALVAAMAVAALQAVGAVLVIGMLVIPGAAAHLLADRFGRMLATAAVFGAATGAVGAYASDFLDGSTGGTIVALQAACFFLVLLAAPRHGWLAARRARKAQAA